MIQRTLLFISLLVLAAGLTDLSAQEKSKRERKQTRPNKVSQTSKRDVDSGEKLYCLAVWLI